MLRRQRLIVVACCFFAMLARHFRDDVCVEMGVVVPASSLLIAAMLAHIRRLEVSSILADDFFNLHSNCLNRRTRIPRDEAAVRSQGGYENLRQPWLETR